MLAIIAVLAYIGLLSVVLAVDTALSAAPHRPAPRASLARSSVKWRPHLLTLAVMVAFLALTLTTGAGRTAIARSWHFDTGHWMAGAAVALALLSGGLLFVTEASVAHVLQRPGDISIRRPGPATRRAGDGTSGPRLGKPLWRLVGALTASAIFEEWIWRAYLMNGMAYSAGRANAIIAVLTSAVLFGLSHLASGRAAWIAKTAHGLAWAVMFALTGTLLWSVLSHAAFNASVAVARSRDSDLSQMRISAL